MKEQEYKIENIDSFELADIFDCGQCFRWNKQNDGSYTGVFKNNVLNVQKQRDTVIFKGICNGDIEETVRDYFDLDRDYEGIKKQLSKIDENVKTSVEYGKGIRILNQDLWETIISFIISANNNIPRIKGIIERLAKTYGKEIEHKTEIFPNKTNVTFAEVIDRNTIKIREWERGTGETIGCGTGCCTATVAAVLTGRCDRKVNVHQIGGILETNWDEETGKMFMKGPSHTVFESEIDVDNIIKKNRITKLTDLLKNVDYELVKGSLDVEISDVKDDSRKVEQDDMYIAKIGSSSDGHKYIPDVIKKGAKVIVVEKDIDIKEDVTVIKGRNICSIF